MSPKMHALLPEIYLSMHIIIDYDNRINNEYHVAWHKVDYKFNHIYRNKSHMSPDSGALGASLGMMRRFLPRGQPFFLAAKQIVSFFMHLDKVFSMMTILIVYS